ncbi:MmcQ/YjbR family DNA-binding protein [Microbacterium caowuchunii]|uniref:MmcQ/YjbR family DNA-binding protein n=1 Tax=Microbacterium caowuchunii TaxID=2614638 RepID=UPI0012487CD8|nr:MmcQ/YjbR family DNA-binding protein [Microbacterium caowuchunii]QEV99591.1 MmcQ/YjbR family DNA-binding protein [Microbacterium caowuchunii]
MATLDDVVRIAESLPDVTMKPAWGNRMWRVHGRGFVWERPLNRTDRAALGDTAPEGEIAAVRVDHELTKIALVESEPDRFFTIPHFDGYDAVLIRLDAIDVPQLRELIVDAWLDRAPTRLAEAYRGEHPAPGDQPA